MKLAEGFVSRGVILCSDWLVYVTWCEYCVLIGWFVSHFVLPQRAVRRNYATL